MLIASFIMIAIAAAVTFAALQREMPLGPHVSEALRTSLFILPLLLAALLTASLIQDLIPAEQVSRWIGEGSGFRGLLMGTVAGALAPGGPFVSFPLVAGMMKAGASIGVLVAFISSWSLLAIQRIPLELGFVGWRFVFVRILCTFFFPVVAGWLAQILFRHWQW